MVNEFDGEGLVGPSAAEDALRWYLTRIAEGIAGDSLDDLTEQVRERFVLNPSPEVMAAFMRVRVRNFGGPFVLLEVEHVSEAMVVGIVETSSGVRWRVFALGDPATGHPVLVGSAQAPSDWLVVREASPGDGRGISDLVQRVPMHIGEHSLLIDYGDDYLTVTGMAEDRSVVVAELDGRIVGVHGFAVSDLIVHDTLHRGRYIRHTRIDPATKGRGVFSALNGAVMERVLAGYTGDLDAIRLFSLVAVANDDVLDLVPEELRSWGAPWERFHLDTAAVAHRGPTLCPVDDIDRIVEQVQHVQGDAAVRVPVDAQRFARRVERTPALYGDDRLRGNKAAVVGVGRSSVIVYRDGARPTREAVAYDIGFDPGADAALVDVLRSWCAELAADGIDRLIVGCGVGSPVRSVVAPFAVDVERYHLNCSWRPPTDGPPSIAFDNALM